MKVFVSGRGRSGMTLVELMVAVAVGSMVLAGMATLFVSSLRNFAGLGNYAELTGQSRLSLDKISREIREASAVVSAQASLPVRSVTLTNKMEGKLVTISWDSDAKVVTMQRAGEDPVVCLTECDNWSFAFYQRSPKSNWGFFPTTDYRTCKLINMSWKCSRKVLSTINTETVVTSQVVLRNKP